MHAQWKCHCSQRHGGAESELRGTQAASLGFGWCECCVIESRLQWSSNAGKHCRKRPRLVVFESEFTFFGYWLFRKSLLLPSLFFCFSIVSYGTSWRIRVHGLRNWGLSFQVSCIFFLWLPKKADTRAQPIAKSKLHTNELDAL